MFPDELEAALAERPIVYFTYGLCEPHGPQNAVGLDALKARQIAIRTAEQHGGIVAPTDYWHIHELGGYAIWGARYVGEVQRKWLTAVPPWVHFKNVCYQIRTAEQIGFKAAILLTGHYGPNWEDLKRLIELVQPEIRMRLFALPDFEANRPGFDGDNKATGDHAGKVETSLLWAVEPDCVDLSRIPAEARDVPPGAPHHESDFVTGNPRGADAAAHKPYFAMGANAPHSDRRVGERMVHDEVNFLAAKAAELIDTYPEKAAGPGLPTFESVERFWAKSIAPEIARFRSMSIDFGVGGAVPDGSVWYENWSVPERF
jgi:creatinine amidohydrolase